MISKGENPGVDSWEIGVDIPVALWLGTALPINTVSAEMKRARGAV